VFRRHRVLVAGGLVTVLLATCGTLLVAAALKSYCLTGWVPGHQPKPCYNDLQTLWYQRDMAAHLLPYQGSVTHVVDSSGHSVVHLGAGQIEYPVLTGVFAWLTSLPVASAAGFLVVSALALAPFALLSAAALYRLAGRRALIFALSPQLAAYAFLNWDLLPVAATAWALWAWRRERYEWAGVLISLGACAKIWPGFLILPFLVQLALARRRPEAIRFLASAVATAALVNLPFLLINAGGWSGPFLAQSDRINDKTTNSLWYWIFASDQTAISNLLSGLTVLIVWAWLLYVGLQRARQTDGGYPAVPVGAAMVAAYIALGRVDSPQYGLWLVPFLVVLAVPRRWIVIFAVTDIWLWGQWSWIYGTPGFFGNAAMVARGVAVAGLGLVFLRSREFRITPSNTAVTTGASEWRTPISTSVVAPAGTSPRPGT
jgi:uncharacterized membrane protein